MGDGVAHHEGGDKVLDRPRLSTVRSEAEGVHTSFLPQLVENCQVDEGVVQVVGVGRVLVTSPIIRCGHLSVKHGILWLGLVINGVKPHDVLQELVQGGVGGGVHSHLGMDGDIGVKLLKNISYLKQWFKKVL